MDRDRLRIGIGEEKGWRAIAELTLNRPHGLIYRKLAPKENIKMEKNIVFHFTNNCLQVMQKKKSSTSKTSNL